MNRYLQSIIVFDVALPVLLLGLPGALLLAAFASFQGLIAARTAEYRENQVRERQVAALKVEMKDLQPKVPLLKSMLAVTDVDARLDNATRAAAEKFSSDEIERTLCDFQSGPSAIGSAYGDGRRLQLKFVSRWEPLNAAALAWETANPNLVLETLSITKASSGTGLGPTLESSMSYYIITEN
jgi:hypothetical protein